MSPKKAKSKVKKSAGKKASAKKPVKKIAMRGKAAVAKKSPARGKVSIAKKPAASAKRKLEVPVVKSSGSLRSSLSPSKRPTAQRAKAAFDGDSELELNSVSPRGTGSDSGGQSGSDQGLSEEAEADSESVEELVEEGQDYEAEIIGGVEEAGNAVEAGVPQRKRKNEFEVEDLDSEKPEEDEE